MLINDDDKKIKILVVEDNAITGLVVSEFFKSLKHDVDVSLTGESAIGKARVKNYDLILMDIGLPGLNGFEASVIIREHEKKNGEHRAKIIAHTAHGEYETGQIKKFGMDDILIKPVSIKQYEEVLKSINN